MKKKVRNRLDELIEAQKSQVEYAKMTLTQFGVFDNSLLLESEFIKKTRISAGLLERLRNNNHIAVAETKDEWGIHIERRYWFTYFTFESLLLRGYISQKKYEWLMAKMHRQYERDSKKWHKERLRQV